MASGGGEADPIDIAIGRELRRQRTALGVSQRVLAERVGLTLQQIQRYERGTSRIGAARLYQFSVLLGMEIDGFFAGVTEPLPTSKGISERPKSGEVSALIDAYNAIDDADVRKRFLDLAKAMSEE